MVGNKSLNKYKFKKESINKSLITKGGVIYERGRDENFGLEYNLR